MSLVKGQIIQIGGIKYDILQVFEEIDGVDIEKNELIGEHTAIYLHKQKSKSLHPTHLLKIYYNNEGKGFLFDILNEKGDSSYINKKEILLRAIQIVTN